MPSKPMAMIVEDDPAIRRLYSFLLRSNGIAVIEAEDGLKAIERFAQYPCALVITGLHMPHIKGTKLIEELRKCDPNVYVMVITADATPAREREVLQEFRANEFIAKPFDFEDFENRVYRFFFGEHDDDDDDEMFE